MTALQHSFTASFSGHGLFDTMPDQTADQEWPHQHHQNQQQTNYIPQMPLLTGQWPPNIHSHPTTTGQQQMLGISGMDRRFYHDDSTSYMGYTSTGASNTLISSGYAPENTWTDSMDMSTPSNFDSPHEPLDSFPHTQSNPSRLQPPSTIPSHSRAPHAPSLSPHLDSPDHMSIERPSMHGRSQTAPVKTHHHPKTVKTPTIKASGSDENESDEDFVPSESNLATKPTPAATNRGRKRQRIPHTAVERRYRENLNAHLERLRQTVPSLASRRTSGGLPLVGVPLPTSGHRASEPGTAPVATLLADGAKPSKCEILNGAIEHIGAVERDNAALREEVKDLRARVEDLQRWYSATLRGAGGNGAVGYVG